MRTFVVRTSLDIQDVVADYYTIESGGTLAFWKYGLLVESFNNTEWSRVREVRADNG